jgi:hypothetical protein
VLFNAQKGKDPRMSANPAKRVADIEAQDRRQAAMGRRQIPTQDKNPSSRRLNAP